MGARRQGAACAKVLWLSGGKPCEAEARELTGRQGGCRSGSGLSTPRPTRDAATKGSLQRFTPGRRQGPLHIPKAVLAPVWVHAGRPAGKLLQRVVQGTEEDPRWPTWK